MFLARSPSDYLGVKEFKRAPNDSRERHSLPRVNFPRSYGHLEATHDCLRRRVQIRANGQLPMEAQLDDKRSENEMAEVKAAQNAGENVHKSGRL